MHNRLFVIVFCLIHTFVTVKCDVPSYHYGYLSQTSQVFARPGQSSRSFYYEAVQVNVYTSGKYTFRSNSSLDTYGYFYSGSFDPLNPSRNLVTSDDDSGGDRQFLLNATLTNGGSYILVITTYGPNVLGDYLIVARGPARLSFRSLNPSTPSPTTSSPSVASYYSGSLSSSSPTFIRPGETSTTFRYQAILITVYASGKYSFTSRGALDAYAYLYSGLFDPSYPSRNLIEADHGSAGSGQFLFNVTLTYGGAYILVVTSYAPDVTASYAFTAVGSSTLTFSTYTPTTVVPPITTSSASVSSDYWSTLTYNSDIFARPGQSSRSFYYEATQVTIYTSGKYTFRSYSIMNTYGYLYSDSFDPLYPSQNLIASDGNSGDGSQFLFNITLAYGRTYILIVTTRSSYTIGNYQVTVLGPLSVNFTPYRLTTTGPMTTSGSVILSSHYSFLSSTSGIFARPDQTSNSYYYQAIQVTIHMSGKYSFKSRSSIDTYSYFYSTSFDAYNPNSNLIISDDDSGGNRQFMFNVTLTYGMTYILVVTTFDSDVLGSFTVDALGPATVDWADLSPTISSTPDVIQILCIVIGCVVFLGLFLSSCAYLNRRQRTLNRRATYLTVNRKAQLGAPGNQMPYVVSNDYTYGSNAKKPPLSNN